MSERKRRGKRKNKALQVVIGFVICVAILITMGVVTFAVVSRMGSQKLKQQATSSAPILTSVNTTVDQSGTEEAKAEETEEEDVLEEGQIYYNGQKYQYNEDIMTFVIMGIDYMGTVDELLEETMGGQSDLIMLGVLNPHKKAIELIAINRNTMTQIHRYATDGTYVDTVDAQITLQHAYGTGGADSCEKMVAAVDNLMYMIPIHGYYAMNMGAISMLNDAIGGVELVALEDLDVWYADNISFKKGERITLLGEDAYWYTKFRDHRIEGSANTRLERQKQYLTAFIHKLKLMVKNDLTIPLELYDIIKDYSVTDVTVDEMTYLVSQAVTYSFDKGKIHTIPGKTVVNGEYEEFYVDEAGLYDIIVEVFYEPVNE